MHTSAFDGGEYYFLGGGFPNVSIDMNALTGKIIQIHAFGGGSSLRKDDGERHTTMLYDTVILLIRIPYHVRRS
jgi:hypothetical protein